MVAKVGDKVKTWRGEGTVVCVYPYGDGVDTMGVQHPEGVRDSDSLHSLDGSISDESGWWYQQEELEVLSSTPVITAGNPIYSYRASDELGNDAWGDLVKGTVGVNTDDLKPTFKSWEGEYTSVTSLPIPGAWRSAKSVIINARKYDVSVIIGDAVDIRARGKSAVERDIKEKKDKLKDVKTPQEKLDSLLNTALDYARQNGLSFTAETATAVYNCGSGIVANPVFN